jgi:hypothetical protein
MGAMLFDEPRHAPRWFLAFAILVTISGFLQPYLRPANNLSSLLVIFFFAINLIGVGSLVFIMVISYEDRSSLIGRRLGKNALQRRKLGVGNYFVKTCIAAGLDQLFQINPVFQIFQ